VPNECPVVDCSRRPDQPHQMHGCRVVANRHEQRNGRAERLGTVETGINISFRYHGARPCIALYASRQSLNEMRSLARSQCRWSRSSGVTWWRLSPPNITLAKRVLTRYSWSNSTLLLRVMRAKATKAPGSRLLIISLNCRKLVVVLTDHWLLL